MNTRRTPKPQSLLVTLMQSMQCEQRMWNELKCHHQICTTAHHNHSTTCLKAHNIHWILNWKKSCASLRSNYCIRVRDSNRTETLWSCVEPSVPITRSSIIRHGRNAKDSSFPRKSKYTSLPMLDVVSITGYQYELFCKNWRAAGPGLVCRLALPSA